MDMPATTDGYDGILVSRPDVVFKPGLRDVLAQTAAGTLKRAVLFPFRTWSCQPATPRGRTRVADTLMWVPSRVACAAGASVTRWFRNHDALDVVPRSVPVRLLLPEQHDSNPGNDWNPLYRLANRREAPFGKHPRTRMWPRFRFRDCWANSTDAWALSEGSALT